MKLTKMKTTSKIKFTTTAMALVILMGSCSKKDDKKFEESSTIRLETAKQELRTDLKSSPEGWKLVYFPMSTEVLSVVPGANKSYSFLFKFTDDTHVQMKSTLDLTRLETSEYALKLGSTLKLEFSTYSILHDLADASFAEPGMGGRARGGEFEFLSYGRADGDLIFQTNRKHVELRFERATKEDWVDMNATITKIMANDFIAPGYVFSASREGTKLKDSILTLTKTGTKTVALYTKTTHPTTGVVTKVLTRRAGLGYGTKGIYIMPGIKFEGKTFYFFQWDAASKKFVSKIDDITAEIAGTSDPKFL
ncbi:DUF4302 domain-containing protein [Pedobacter sp. N36a]|uniref:DUF4302 domain-containing protein n=1 Tax=Pedobacter sp. N36a TaxID=2767996 RepID=UPI001656E240|nr:DUF4302 domain-containing protein [Pedobacter sp. N36a]MBC8987962.1 DUF4302 domain-containing protein [Pedobacter sp. N36a]